MPDSRNSAADSPRLLERQMNRRDVLKRSLALGASVPAIAALLASCADDEVDDTTEPEAVVDDEDDEIVVDDDEDEPVDDVDPVDEPDDDEDPADEPDEDDDGVNGEGEGVYGGTMNVALIADPPTLDIHTTTAVTVNFFAWHIYEPLFTWDGDMESVPELAEDHEVSEDGLLNTLTLRQGVTFHNGEDMIAADVIASIEHWGEMIGVGEGLLNAVDELVEVDDYTIEFQMNQPFGGFATVLGRQTGGCAIYPASVIENGVDEYIGTGTYQLVEHVPDQHIHLERFEDYQSREEETSGYAGLKHQYVDEIYFIPAPDEASRVSGLQAGDFDYLEDQSPDQFEALEGDDNVVAEVLPPHTWSAWVFNTQGGVLADPLMRQAVQAALNLEEMAIAGYGEGMFRIDPGVLLEETAFHTTSGEEFYNQGDLDRAMELAEEAGYDGEPIRFLASQEYMFLYNMALVGTQQLEDAGLTVDLQVFDWATLLDRREDQDGYEIFTTFMSFAPDPLALPWIAGTRWPGWWDTDEKLEIVSRIETETDFDARAEAFEELQSLFYEVDVPIVKICDAMDLNARSTRIGGFEPVTQLGVALWNMWLED